MYSYIYMNITGLIAPWIWHVAMPPHGPPNSALLILKDYQRKILDADQVLCASIL